MRLATFNILHGRTVADDLVIPERLRQAVQDLDADVLALQEVDRDQPRSHLADLTAVAADAMGAVSSQFVAAISGTPGATWMAATGRESPGTASYGIALLSRYPVLDWQVLRLPRIPAKFPMWLRVPRKIIVVHEEPRAVVVGRFDTPTGPLVVANTHLSFVPGWNRLQLQRIRRYLRVFDEPVVLMGDLNMAGRAPAELTGFTPLATHPTFPLAEPTEQLDHILLRGSLGPVVSSDAPLMPLSDHRALVVDLA
ncbi:endonuclease/exonuclease/phosphatase family protein [Nakamurella leprariae]|uniref:Endonuclease/exonuclease/phosphatase family protein n=1 Tax=Nakamurella leprariae TaxID=2803911 RepID=A0A939C052_9ACTN|nr:endonuclease/exonuclease/phosphatase family protein [Nakamurella leprariae]MBM9468401.1 endonuclease/exonuclease/phosphatase family protein [Nakamurella leprariae]